MRLNYRLAAGVLASFAFVAFLGADEAPVSIHLSRPEKVGNLINAEATVDKTTNTTQVGANGLVAKNTEAKHWDLTTRIEILKVDDKGLSTRTLLTIKKYSDDKGTELLPAGTEIDVERGDASVSIVRVDKGEIGAMALEGLRTLYPPRDPQRPTEDEVFGTQEARKSGDSWNVNADALKRGFPKARVDPKNISGKTTLVGVERQPGVQLMHLQAEYKATGIVPDEQPPNWKMEPYQIDYRADFHMPVDVRLPMVDSTLRTTQRTQFSNADGYKMSRTTETIVTGKYARLQRGDE